jgi:hypothetical protein
MPGWVCLSPKAAAAFTRPPISSPRPGSPENLIPRMRRLQERMGIDLLLMEVAQGGAPPAKVRNAVTLFAKEVMPALRSVPA